MIIIKLFIAGLKRGGGGGGGGGPPPATVYLLLKLTHLVSHNQKRLTVHERWQLHVPHFCLSLESIAYSRAY